MSQQSINLSPRNANDALAGASAQNISSTAGVLSAAKQQLLQKLASTQPALPSGDLEKTSDDVKFFSPSWGQKGLWIVDQASPKDPVYNMPVGFILEGVIDAKQLEMAINDTVERHESLRSSFILSRGEPSLSISSTLCVLMRMIDMSESVDPVAELKNLAELEAITGFDLSTAPLFRVVLAHLGKNKHAFLLTIHHSIVDGHSLGVILQDISAAYAARINGNAVNWTVVTPYHQFVDTQKQWLVSPAAQQATDYFRKILHGQRPLANLPLDRPRSKFQTFRGASVTRDLDSTLVQRLENLAKEQRVTPFMLTLACYALLLHRYTLQDDLFIGAPAANRIRKEFERTVGLLANNLIMRVDFSGYINFSQLLARVRSIALQSYTHQSMPFEKLLGLVESAERVGTNPLFQVYFNYIDQIGIHLDLPGVNCTAIEMQERGAKHELTCFYLRGQQHQIMINYNHAIFDPETADQMVDGYHQLLKQVVENPERQLWAYDVIGDSQRRKLDSFNETARVYADKDGSDRGSRSLHGLIKETSTACAARIAVADEHNALTFTELDRRANAFALFLRAKGVERGKFVGVCMERSVELEVALLAVLKAGAAYIPLDPSYPATRLSMMLQDSSVKVVLVNQSTVSLVSNLEGITSNAIIAVDQLGLTSTDKDVDLDFDNADLTYVIYTSGSTGKPKGAMNHHRGIVNRLLWMQKTYQLDERDVILQKTPAGFDVSVWEFFWPLLAGAKLFMARPGGHQDPEYLIETILKQRVTVIHFVPSMLRAFLQSPDVQSCGRQLRCVICSGEALSIELADQFFKILPNVELHNLYGPTEAAVDVTYHACRPGENNVSSIASIGRPIDNTQIHILGRHMEVLPIGVAGELYIGGVQVARGYLNRPELTADRFIHDPFSSVGSAQLYKSGDLARWTANGEIEFFGRLDFQVKIRGQRIELGEVETALLSLDASFGINEAAVNVCGEVGLDQRLVAYLTLKTGWRQPGIEQLRAALSSRLPDSMIPSQFVFLEKLPLSANGKLDRKALPSPPEMRERTLQQKYVAPYTPVQRALAEVWHRALKLPAQTPVGLHDNFFALGGDSILAMQVVADVRDRLRASLQLRDFFTAPTIADLSQFLCTDPQHGLKVQKTAELMEQIEKMSGSQMKNLLDSKQRSAQLTERNLNE